MIYFDSAATTLLKPTSVSHAVSRAIRTCASPGRGDHHSTRLAEEFIFRCRSELCELFSVPSQEQVVFTGNATHALNLAIRSIVHPGSRVLISPWEHNAVTRTLASIPEVNVKVAEGSLFDDEALLKSFRNEIDKRPDAVICTCVSNVFGYCLPFELITKWCKDEKIPIILDASQAAGCISISMNELSADYIAFPGHKGLYGPQGTGVLLCGAGRSVLPLMTGGTGSNSLAQEMPDFLPDRAEAGTANVPGIAGLLEGVRYVRKTGVSAIYNHELLLRKRLEQSLDRIDGVELFSSKAGNQTGVLSFRCRGFDCATIAQSLGEMGIAVRSGLHCAPLAHRRAGTVETGTIRISFCAFNTHLEVDWFIAAMNRIIYSKLT